MQRSLSGPDLLLCHPPSEWIPPVSPPAWVCSPCIQRHTVASALETNCSPCTRHHCSPGTPETMQDLNNS